MGRSSKQNQRQSTEYRNKGKYALVNPCMACGKSAGVDYSSHPMTDCGDWADSAICLCIKCWDATSEMTDPAQFDEYKKQFGDAADVAWAKVAEQRD